jgi:hypothetical protein
VISTKSSCTVNTLFHFNFCLSICDVLGDLEHKRKVRSDRQHKFTLENGLSSHLVSARTGEMVSFM